MIFLLKLWLILIGIVIIIFSSYTGLYYYYSKKPIQKFKNKIFPEVTLVIPFYNEAKILNEKIKDLSLIDYPKKKLNIIFLNDHSTDKSVDIIKKCSKRLPFKFNILNNKGGQGKHNALNYIFPKLKTEITVINDADSYIKNDAILRLAQGFQEENVGGVNARMEVMSKEKNGVYNNEKDYRFFYDIWRQGESNLHSISICNGILMAFRTELLKDVILKSEADDTELIFKITKRNFRVIYKSDAIAYETLPLTYSERLKQKMRRVRGIIKIYLNNLNLIGMNKFGDIIYPYTLLTYVISPYLVLLGALIYVILLFKIPFFFLTLIFFLIPKIGSFGLSFIATQIIMALSPFLAKGWNTAKSSKEELSK